MVSFRGLAKKRQSLPSMTTGSEEQSPMLPGFIWGHLVVKKRGGVSGRTSFFQKVLLSQGPKKHPLLTRVHSTLDYMTDHRPNLFQVFSK
jgi:hypothetical protein